MDDVRRWKADLDRAITDIPKEVEKVGAKGALNVKKDWQQAWSGHSHIPHLPSAISYDMRRHAQDLEWEIGPDKNKRQGPLGNLIEFGSRNNAPIPGGLPALEREAPRFEAALEDALAKAFR